MLRRPDSHPNQQIAFAVLTEDGQSLAPDPEHCFWLSARRNPQLLLAVWRRNIVVSPESGLGKGYRQVKDQVIALTLEPLVVLDVQHDEEIAIGAVSRSRGPLPPEREVVVRGHACRYIHRHAALAPDPALTPANLAGLGDDSAFASTGRTGGNRNELAEHAASGSANFPAAVAGRACGGLSPGLRTASFARLTALQAFELDCLLCSEGNLGQGEPHGHPDVLTPAFFTPAPSSAEERFEPAHGAEVAHEDVERFAEVDVVESIAAAGSAQTCLAVPVIHGPLLRVAQNLVCLGDLLELRFRLRRGITVWMVLHRELPIGLLDLRIGGLARDAQQRVELAHSSNPSTRRLVCSTSPMILSYGMRVGPMTPMTPLRPPTSYEEVTRVKSLSRASGFSAPMVTEIPRCRRDSRACLRRSRPSVSRSSSRIRVFEANSGCSASICALPRTTGVPWLERSNKPSPSAMKMLSSSR